MRATFRSICKLLVLLLAAANAAGDEPAPDRKTPPLPEVVIVPTLRNDHQFNLDYTVAHLAALLDVIRPESVIVDDYTEWLRRECPWYAILPEMHVALAYVRENSVPVFGIDTSPNATFESMVKVAEDYRKRYEDPLAVERDFRSRLDSTTASIAREYSFTGESRQLQVLLTRVFPLKRSQWTQDESDFHARSSKRICGQVGRIVASNPSQRRWAVVLRWEHALLVEESLGERGTVKVVPVLNYLPLESSAVEKRMDNMHVAWILSGVLDEWYGMWAPQVFPGDRVRELLVRLKQLSPQHPATRYLEARWLMQNRDYSGAETILKQLVDTTGDAKFPFPINGKWIRPPWSSVRDKAKLNLAFVCDYNGERDEALKLYRELLQKGDGLNEEARAVGYIHDDIYGVIESYTKSPYTAAPMEAFRHHPIVAKEPACAPGRDQGE